MYFVFVKIRPLMDGNNYKLTVKMGKKYVKIRPLMDGNI